MSTLNQRLAEIKARGDAKRDPAATAVMHRATAVRATGAEIVTLSPQLPDFSRLWVEEDGIEFPVLSDLGLGVAGTYGLVFALPDDLRRVYVETLKIDLARFNGDESWTLPLPATLVVDSAGVIRYRSVDPDYTVRPEPEEALDALGALT